MSAAPSLSRLASVARRALPLALLFAAIGGLGPDRAWGHERGLTVLRLVEQRADGGGAHVLVMGSAGLEPVLDGCTRAAAAWRCPEGLTGVRLSVVGLESGLRALVHVETASEVPRVHELGPGESVALGARREGSAPTWQRFARLGLEHVAGGLDHALFVIGLVLLTAGLRSRLAAVTAFTLGHGLSLAVAVLAGVGAPVAPTELLIALSVAFLARSALIADAPRASTPLGASFGFGLVHGLGFARGLVEHGWPAAETGSALLGFNLGVELAQLAVVVTASVVAALGRRGLSELARDRARRALAHAMGGVAAWMVLERLPQLGAAGALS